ARIGGGRVQRDRRLHGPHRNPERVAAPGDRVRRRRDRQDGLRARVAEPARVDLDRDQRQARPVADRSGPAGAQLPGSPGGPVPRPPARAAPSGKQIGQTEDDVSLLWRADSSQTASAVSMLNSASPPLSNIAGIGEIFSGPAIGTMFNLPGLPPTGDPRTPDIVITTNVGVIYTAGRKKVMEHGGFARDDTNVMLLVANPALAAATVTSPVQTAQIAPTVLQALGRARRSVEAARREHTQSLRGLHF